MADTFPPSKRSEIMSRVRSYGNKSTEKKLISIFKENKITGWRRRYPIFGHPDFSFPKKRIVIFVDGCFWHGCRIHFRQPASNSEYWIKKIQKNKIRDKEVSKKLKNDGWMVFRLWEHDLKNWTANRKIKELLAFIRIKR